MSKKDESEGEDATEEVAGKQTYAHSDRQNSSIQVGPTTIATVAGPINEWACIPENLPNHPTMAFFGKRRTGKSTTITNIAFHCCQNIPFGIVMSDTAYAGKVLCQFSFAGFCQSNFDTKQLHFAMCAFSTIIATGY
jgi:hypothetical protein